MTDTDADSIDDQIAADAEAGIASFSDGTNSVGMVPLKDRLEVASKLRRRTTPLTAADLMRGATKINGPAGALMSSLAAFKSAFPSPAKPKKADAAIVSDLMEKIGRRVNASYDAARTPDDLAKYWANADGFDADSANSPQVRQTLVRRQRYELANNGYADGIAQTYSTDLVGVGPSLRMQTGSSGFNQLVENTWFFWCKAIKFRRKLWAMTHAKHGDGEALAIIAANPKIKHRIQLDISLRETEQCHTPFIPLDDPYYVDGIKLDKYDNPVWYDFLAQHPGKANGLVGSILTPTRVPANRILHWFKMRRAGQHRGVPECASTLNLGAAFRRGREATLSTWEKIATFTLLLKTMFEPEEIQALPAGATLDVMYGLIQALPNGVEPTQLKAEHPGPSYGEFHKLNLNEMARPKNMPRNKAGCDSSDYNYASGRLDHQTYYGNLDVDREDCNDLVLDPLFDVWFDVAIAVFGWLGGDPSAVGPFARAHGWDWPKHLVADIQAEADANRTKLESGQIFLDLLYSESGQDFEDRVTEFAGLMNITPEVLKKRLLDVILPVQQQVKAMPGNPTADAVAAAIDRMRSRGELNLGHVNGNGAHHG